jgi:hypothetical protein
LAIRLSVAAVREARVCGSRATPRLLRVWATARLTVLTRTLAADKACSNWAMVAAAGEAGAASPGKGAAPGKALSPVAVKRSTMPAALPASPGVNWVTWRVSTSPLETDTFAGTWATTFWPRRLMTALLSGRSSTTLPLSRSPGCRVCTRSWTWAVAAWSST